MNHSATTLDDADVNTSEAETSILVFVEDAEYEFVGGGNAVNGY